MDALTFGRLRDFGRLDQALLLLSIAASAAFMATRAIQPFPGSAVLKGLAVAPLAVLAFRVLGKAERRAGYVGGGGIRDSRLLASALALSCVGDVLLQLGWRRYFLHALGAFLLAHIAYILLFARNWPRPLRPPTARVILAALVLVYGVAMCGWLWSGLSRFLVPALAYASALTAMTVSAILTRFSRPFVLSGAVLFLISDSLLAAGFKVFLPLAAFLIWPTYYLGQYGITLGLLREKAADDRPLTLKF
jgi:uncharacterized membrane protein YhhN